MHGSRPEQRKKLKREKASPTLQMGPETKALAAQEKEKCFYIRLKREEKRGTEQRKKAKRTNIAKERSSVRGTNSGGPSKNPFARAEPLCWPL